MGLPLHTKSYTLLSASGFQSLITETLMARNGRVDAQGILVYVQ